MTYSGNSPPTDDQPGPPPDSDGGTPPPESGAEPDLEQTLARAEAILRLMTDWLTKLQSLARVEFSRSLAAGTRILLLQVALIPLAFVFFVSLCGGVGLAGYYFFQSIYIGFIAFITTQALVILAIVLYQQKLRALLGFGQTRQQIRRASEALSHVFTSNE
ncbi:hypothetical protein [Microbulbifer discodermiae]|uniref:hypothetical protein n=1 Tax=Microbulbifer sp. 2201CG32-9 TaxID=3232309 RepID=UPI00345BFDF6